MSPCVSLRVPSDTVLVLGYLVDNCLGIQCRPAELLRNALKIPAVRENVLRLNQALSSLHGYGYVERLDPRTLQPKPLPVKGPVVYRATTAGEKRWAAWKYHNRPRVQKES